MRKTTVKTLREETVIELDESDIIALIREKFDLHPWTEVEFDIGQDMLRGATIKYVTSKEVKE